MGVGIETLVIATEDRVLLQRTGVLPDWAIRKYITIENFVDYGQCTPGTVSYGLTSAGYDLRVGRKFKIFTNASCATVDPKKMDPKAFHDVDLTPRQHNWTEVPAKIREQNKILDTTRSYRYKYQCDKCYQACDDTDAFQQPCGEQPDHVLIPPNSFALAESIERLWIPRNVVCWCVGKSTYARCGINMNFTPFEPGWYGIVTIEIINATPLPVKIYAGEGIGQAQFFLLAGDPEKSYAEKSNAKYQGQTGLTLPEVK